MVQQCEKCHVALAGAHSLCPLCQSKPAGTPDAGGNTFPVLPTIIGRHNLLVRVLFFLSAVLVVLCFAANYLFSYPGFWSFFVALGVVFMWCSVGILLRKRHDIPKAILWQAIWLSAAMLVLDWLTGWHHWAIDYAAPCFFIVAMLALWAVAGILRLRIEEYLVYLLLDVLIGIVPIIFIIFDLVDAKIPSLLCVLTSIISLIALLSFKDKAVRSEVKRRLHM